jgi:Cu+-exporting ATPase
MNNTDLSKLEQIDLSLSGMTCSSCVATIERSLNKVEGAQATVNLATETAHILVPEGMKIDLLLDAVKKAGYSAKLRTDEIESFSHSRNMGIRAFLAIALSIPVVILSMWHSFHYRLDEFIISQLQALNIPEPLYSPTGWVVIALSAPVVLLIAWPIHRAAIRNLKHPTMDNLISLGSLVAFTWSIYANSTGAGEIYAEVGAVVVAFIVLGRYLESRAKKRAGSSLANLLSLKPKEVRILRSGEEVLAPIHQLGIGELCIVRSGERVPTDGIVMEGVSSVDNSLLTGESLPIEVKPGSEVIAGSINQGGRLVIEAKRVGSDTELSRITRMVLTAQSEKAPIQRLADRISGVFVPIVVSLAVLTLITWIYLGNPLDQSIAASVALLVIACPCALGLATPVAFLVATGKGASNGIVLRRSAALEIAPKITTVVFDKTGTLTTGAMKVKAITQPEIPELGLPVNSQEILMAIHSLEHESTHPIALAISGELADRGVARLKSSEFFETAGQGVAARVTFSSGSLPVLIGTPESIRRSTLNFHKEIEESINSARARGNSIAVVAVDGIATTVIEVGDSLKPDAAEAIVAFKKYGIESWLLTGDNETAAREIARQVGISDENTISLATPEDKILKIKELRSQGERVLMIGDGVNDAAALAEADLSMAMGTGTDTAIATADITLMRPTLYAALDALALSQKTLKIIRTNLGWAFIYNLIGIPIAALGYMSPMYAGGAMAASSLLVVLNSLRLNRNATLTR